MGVIISLILVVIVVKNLAKYIDRGEALINAFKEAHEEIEREAKTNPNATNFVFYDPANDYKKVISK